MSIRSRRLNGPAARGTALAVAALIGAGSLAACSSDDASSSSSPEKAGTGELNVVATTTQICDYVKQIDAPDTNLTCLLAPNASAHEHEMTKEQMKALSEADLMLVNGVDLEHFLDQAVDSSGFKGTMVVTTGILSATDLDGKPVSDADLPYTIDRGIKKIDVQPWPFPPEEGETQAEFAYDPHVWTSPENAKIQVENIGHAFEEARPDQADMYKKHVEAYTHKLDELNTWVKEQINTIPEPNRVLFTSHDAFGYFSKTYGINFIGAALSDFNEQQDATAEHIAEEAQKVKDSGAVALFAENSNNPKSIEAIAKAAGVKAVIGDDALYGDSLGPAGSEGETYIGSIVHNVTNLVDAWGGHATPPNFN